MSNEKERLFNPGDWVSLISGSYSGLYDNFLAEKIGMVSIVVHYPEDLGLYRYHILFPGEKGPLDELDGCWILDEFAIKKASTKLEDC